MIAQLRAMRFFRGCSDLELASLVERFPLRTLAAGEQLYAAGEAAEALYVLISGRIHLRSTSWEGRTGEQGESVRAPDHLFGLAALQGTPRKSDAVAIEPSVVLEVPVTEALSLQEEHPWLKSLLAGLQLKTRQFDQVLGWLRHTPLFRGLPPLELEKLINAMQLRQFSAGAFVIRQGERGATLGLIVRGEARMMLEVGTGKRVELATLTEGDLYGESGLLDSTLRETTVQAVTPLTVLTLHRDDLLDVAGEAPFLLERVSRHAGGRFSDALEVQAERSSRGICVLATSHGSRAGRTTLVIQLAASLDREGRTVAVVDAAAPFSPPQVARLLRLPARTGSASAGLSPVGEWRSVTVYQPNLSELEPAARSAWLQDLKARHEVVLIDGSPLSSGGEALLDGLIPECEFILHLTARPGVEVLPLAAYRRQVLQVVPQQEGPADVPYIGRDIHLMPYDHSGNSQFRENGIPWVLARPGTRSAQAIRRLKRAILRRQVGIALAGGGTWGFSHIGVLQVLEAHQIPIDMVVGTSAGAIIGGLYAAGRSGLEIETFVRQLVSRGFVQYLLPRPLRRRSLQGTTSFERFARDVFGERRLTELRVPFWPNAMDFHTGEEVVFRNGLMYQGITAAAALPGVLEPYTWNGRVLLDGGFVNNLPLGLLYEQGCHISVGVNCIPHLQSPSRPAVRARPWSWLEALNPLEIRPAAADGSTPTRSLLNPLQLVSTLNMVMRGVQMLSHRVGEESGRLADVYIAPDVGSAQWFEFHKVEGLIEAGRQAAQGALERIHEVCPRDE